MGEFEDCIGEVPGRSSSLFALYTDLSKMETKLELTGVHLRHLPSKADSWRGAAANAFEVALKNEVKQAQRLESGADKAADAILKYAHAMQSTEKKISSARAQMRALDRQVDAVADDEREKKVDELTPRAQSIARGAKQAINDLHRAGEVCAAELRAALHLEAVEPNKEGNNKGELHVLDRRDVDRVNAGRVSSRQSECNGPPRGILGMLRPSGWGGSHAPGRRDFHAALCQSHSHSI